MGGWSVPFGAMPIQHPDIVVGEFRSHRLEDSLDIYVAEEACFSGVRRPSTLVIWDFIAKHPASCTPVDVVDSFRFRHEGNL